MTQRKHCFVVSFFNSESIRAINHFWSSLLEFDSIDEMKIARNAMNFHAVSFICWFIRERQRNRMNFQQRIIFELNLMRRDDINTWIIESIAFCRRSHFGTSTLSLLLPIRYFDNNHCNSNVTKITDEIDRLIFVLFCFVFQLLLFSFEK